MNTILTEELVSKWSEQERIEVALKLAPNLITRQEAADIAKDTGGDPHVWDRLYGLTS